MPEPDAPAITTDPEAEPEPIATPTPVPRDVPTMDATYHVALWTEPAPTYVCLLCTITDVDHAGILDHLATVHEAEAIPSPLAADYLAQTPLLMAMRPPVSEEVSHGGAPATEPDPTA